MAVCRASLVQMLGVQGRRKRRGRMSWSALLEAKSMPCSSCCLPLPIFPWAVGVSLRD